jgi:integrase
MPTATARNSGTKLEAITAPDVRALVDKLRDKRLRATTMRRYLASLRAMLAEAVADGVLTRNPAESVRVFVPGERRRKPRTLTPEQIHRLLRTIPDAHHDLVLFLAHTGVRISEALAATCDLRLENGAPSWSSATRRLTPGSVRCRWLRASGGNCSSAGRRPGGRRTATRSSRRPRAP